MHSHRPSVGKARVHVREVHFDDELYEALVVVGADGRVGALHVFSALVLAAEGDVLSDGQAQHVFWRLWRKGGGRKISSCSARQDGS